MLATGEAPRPGRSRIKGLQASVPALLRLRKAMTLLVAYRGGEAAQMAVAAKIAERVEQSLDEIKTLNLPPDPRTAKRTRKTPHPRTSR
jgi:hypothetical protein